MQSPVNLAQKLSTFTQHWQPRVVAQLNDNEVMVVKVQGDFVWHKHDDTDDFFLVLSGVLDIELREEAGRAERTVTLHPGELFVVPRGVQHRPVARHGEVEILLIEPKGTLNTGDANTASPRIYI